MLYRVRHITEYLYANSVSSCYNLAHMMPRDTLRQRCIKRDLHVSPNSSYSNKHEDYFGNHAYHFEIQQSHKQLVICSESEVEVSAQFSGPNLDFGITCAQAKVMLLDSQNPQTLFSREFLLDSPMVKVDAALYEYASSSFEPDRPLLSAVGDLTKRINNDFNYNPQATTVSTPLSKVLELRSGVCQDFAHLQVGCLRAMGFPAKYISGYIETQPLPGEQRLVGADATHAWVSVFSPGEGWFEFDPTNNQISGEQHIVTAWGRDYSDVTPLQGIIYGGGSEPLLKVSVDVARM